MLKKSTFFGFLVSVPICLTSYSLLAKPDMQTDGLKELKETCMRLRENNQTKPFGIKVECSGKFSYWDREETQTKLNNRSFMRAQTSTKGGRYQTSESFFEKEMRDQSMSCPVLSKKVIASPAGVGIIVNIDRCEDLDAQNLKDLCETKVLSYCHDNQDTCYNQDKQQAGKDAQIGGACTIEEVQRVDTCRSYN